MGTLPESSRLAADVLGREGFPEDSRIVIAVFPFYNFPNKTEEGYGRIAPFACRNYYKELIFRMKGIIRHAPPPLSALKKSDYRLFCNSSLPEKKMASEAGLGFIGRNSLLITPEFGSTCLIAGMILPATIPLSASPRNNKRASCASCTLCMTACPTGAVTREGFEREKCLQSWTSDKRILPEAIKENWGNRIYGCTTCQDICPWNRKLPEGRTVKRGEIPSGLSLQYLIEAKEDDIKALLKGSAMGMNWIGPMVLKRNAVLTAVSENRKDLLPLIEQLNLNNQEESLREACEWALQKLRTSPEQ